MNDLTRRLRHFTGEPHTGHGALDELAAIPRRFQIEIEHPTGRIERFERIGGAAMDHSMHAMDLAGIGGVVRVRPL